MEEMSLQFRAESSMMLHWTLLGCISAVLVGYGVWLLARRRVRQGLVSLAAAAGAIAPALLIDGALGRGRGRRRGGTALACAAAAGGTLAVVLVILSVPHRSQAVWLAVLAFQVAAAVGVLYAAVYAYLGPGRIAALMALRCGAIVAVMLVLFKPALQFAPQGSKGVLTVLLDSSGSMATRDSAEPSLNDPAGRPATRYERAVRRLRAQQERLEEHFDVAWRHFSSELEPVESFDEMRGVRIAGATAGTDIAAAIARTVRDAAPGASAGALLVSDGIHNARNDLDEATASASGAKVRIYTAGIGSLDEPKTGPGGRNIQVLSVDAPKTVIRNNVTTLNVRVKVTGMTGRGAELHMTEPGSGAAAKVVPIDVPKGERATTVKVRWRPADSAAKEPMGAGRSEVRRLHFSVPVVEGEASADDNAADLHVLVTQPRIRVLYVEGRIRPEYKFLRLRIAKDPNVQFLGLIRIKDSQFWSYGSIDGQRLGQLPLTDREFGLFDVLILGDLHSSFLTRRRMARIRKFVDDGGGLVVLGGHHSFGPGGYGGTDIEAVLPVTAGPVTQPQETTEFLPRLTAAGQDHPIFEGVAGSFPGPSRPKPLPDAAALRDLLGCVTVVGPKSGAEVLAIHPTRRNAAGPLVVLAVQQFGKGRTVALTADTTWRWYAPMRGLDSDGPYQRFWAQLVRWAAHVDTKTRKASPSVILRQDRPFVAVNKPVRLRATVHGVEAAEAGKAEVNLAVVDARGKTVATSQMVPIQEAGTYAVVHRPEKAGTFTLKVTAADKAGKPFGADELPLTVATHTAETDRTARDTKTLRRIAEDSGGQNADIKQLPELVDSIIERHKAEHPAPPLRIVKLYYFLDYLFGQGSTGFTALFLILVALLTTEWMLRRRWQLH